MAEKTLYDKIVEKGLAEAKQILENGKERVQEIINEAISFANQEADKMLSSTKQKTNDEIKTKTIEFEQQAKHQILKTKKDLIENTFLQVVDKLNQLPDNEFNNLVIAMIKSEKITGKETLQVSKNDIKRYHSLFSSNKETKDGFYLLDKLNKQLGAGFELKLSIEPADINGGMLILGKQYDVDLSYKALLNKVKEKYEPSIAKTVFQAED